MRYSFFQANRRLSVLGTAVAAIGLLLFLIHALVTAVAADSGPLSPLAQPNAPTITPTVSFEDAFAAYLEAHTIQGNILPTPTPEAATAPAEAAGDPVHEVNWSGATSALGFPGEAVNYTLVLSNSGNFTDTFAITYSADWPTVVSTDSVSLTAGSGANITVTVSIPANANEDDTAAAVLTATSQLTPTITAVITLTTAVESSTTYLPAIFSPLPPPPTPTLSATRPNSANDWQLNWAIPSYDFVIGYELQETQDPTFATGVTTLPLGNVNSLLDDHHQASPNNVYYFRVRTLAIGDQVSDWSNTVRVVGAYADEFGDNQTGWSGPTLKEGLRRLTFIEKIDAWYEWPGNDRWFILRVEESWDWGIASPMMPAPEPPYSIEFRSRPANLGNLVSHGVVFGGDWNGQPCPDWSTVQGVYAHTNCFNRFYTSNLIWYSDNNARLLWERVDTLVWCPNCGGSPLKRLGDIDENNVVELVYNASDWNDYRIEVREVDIRFYVNNQLRFTYNDANSPDATRWIDGPYFGVFASTDEYSNSTGRFDYIRVTPLDN